MRAVWLVVLICASGSPAWAAPLGPPIAAAAQGLLQCYAPDLAHKTCKTLSAFRSGDDGTIENAATMLIWKTPMIVMRTVSRVEIKAGQVCSHLSPQEIETAEFTLGKGPADPSQTASLRKRIASVMKRLFGREICTAYVAKGDWLLAKATIDGVSRPGADQKVIWVSPTDGYRVGP